MPGPRLSIVVPTFNRAHLLSGFLDSTRHAPADCEIVIIDNASTDATSSVVQRYARADSRIRYFRNPENIGVIGNHNRGLELTTGQTVCFMGDDDICLPGNFERKLGLLDANPDIGLVYSQWNRIDVNGQTQGVVLWPGVLTYSYVGTRNEFLDLLPASYLTFQAVVFRRTLYDRYGGFDENPQMNAGTDWDLMLRYCYHAKTAFIAEPLVAVRAHEQSYSETVARKQGKFAPARIAIWRKWLVEHDNPPVLDESLWQRMARAFLPDLQHEFAQDQAQVSHYLEKLDALRCESIQKVSQAALLRMSAPPSTIVTSEHPFTGADSVVAGTVTSIPEANGKPAPELDVNQDDARWAEIYEGVKLADIPQHYATFSTMPFLAKYFDKVFSLCGPGARVLETGIGFGYGAIWLSRRGVQAEGIDYSPQIVERAETINKLLGGRASFRYGDFFRLSNCAADTYDVVFHQGVLEHFSDAEICDILRQQVALSRFVVFSVPSAHYPFGREFGNERHLTLDEWRAILAEFDIDTLTYYGDPNLGAREHVMGVLRGAAHVDGSAPGSGKKTSPAIAWHAPIRDPSGYADEARHFLFALDKASADVSARELRWNDRVALLPPDRERIIARFLAAPTPLNAVHVWHILAPHFQVEPTALANVGRTMFETDRLPDGWADACNRMDAVWVPTEFNRETFARSGVAAEKLRVVPGAIDVALFDPDAIPLRIDGARGFNFLSIFDWTLRKGWDILIRAYVEEFAADEDVALLFKVHSSLGSSLENIVRSVESFLIDTLGRDPNRVPDIVFQDVNVPDARMPGLYRAADCYVMPTRGEGWGRPLMEAMAMGLPTIATNWSGQTEFMTKENSLLIDCTVTDVPELGWREIPTYRGHQWAEPNGEHLRQTMRRVFEDRAGCRKFGERARQEITERYNYARVAALIAAEAERLR